MLDERVEIPVTVEQREAALDAVRGNHGIDRLAHRDPERAQRAEIPGRLEGEAFGSAEPANAAPRVIKLKDVKAMMRMRS